ncbi:uncharacterized protein [Nicotiana tomentosiformis]|uniref:uncharacterized protein n=1 Tax=Nicotiana tomentosiformis TaxID=4098 RepID=UPI00388CE2BD
MRFGKKEKLSAGLYRIIQRIGQVAYKLELPTEMSLVHPIFHVSMLKKVVGDPSVIVPVETIEVNEELTYEEIPVAILDRWWEAYERHRLVGAAPLTWHEFSVLFLEKFVPQTHREELHRQFEQLCQDGMSVTQYEMRFSELAGHAVWLVPT